MTIYPQPKPRPAAPAKKEPREKTERAKAKDRALDEWKAVVKARAGNTCEMATIEHRCWGGLDAHHVLTRGARPRLTLDMENGVALCRAAHDLVHRARWFRPHFNAWFDSKFPGRRARLEAKARREARLA